MTAAYVFQTEGRSRRTAVALAVSWLLIGLAVFLLNIMTWIAALLVLATLPAIRDLWANPLSGLRLDDTTLRWHSGRRSAEIPLAEIEKARLDRRWDFTMRLSLVPLKGRRIRLPYECTPPADVVERELTRRGVKTERNPFSLL